MNADALQEKTRRIAAALDALYGPRVWRRGRPPIDELVLTILSQHTSDGNSGRAFRSLRERYPTWTEVVEAPVSGVADAIRTGGLAHQKAPRIQAVLRDVLANGGDAHLAALATLPVAEARRSLTLLPGVGPKTASCVLLFSLGMPAMPIDTHVYRVAGRLSLIGRGVSPEAAHEHLEEALGGTTNEVYAFHVNLIAHGRALCRARQVLCERCPLVDDCDYYQHLADRPHASGSPN